MNPSLRFLGAALLGWLSVVINARGAEPAPPAGSERAAIQAVAAGDYAGNWKGDAEGAGALKISLKKEASRWIAESSFTFEGAEIQTKLKAVEVEGAKVQLVFEWNIQGAPGQSRLTGEVNGDGLKGTYETTGEAGNSTGTWTVARR